MCIYIYVYVLKVVGSILKILFPPSYLRRLTLVLLSSRDAEESTPSLNNSSLLSLVVSAAGKLFLTDSVRARGQQTASAVFRYRWGTIVSFLVMAFTDCAMGDRKYVLGFFLDNVFSSLFDAANPEPAVLDVRYGKQKLALLCE